MERKSFLLRIDPKLWAELEAWAQDELRSVNGQVEYLLRQAVQKRKRSQRQNNPQSIKLPTTRSEEHTSELQSRLHLVCRLLLEKKKKTRLTTYALCSLGSGGSLSTIQTLRRHHRYQSRTLRCSLPLTRD